MNICWDLATCSVVEFYRHLRGAFSILRAMTLVIYVV